MDYRVEQKYLISEDTIAYLRKRLALVMDYDAHASEDGYLIRSIYFDDMYDTCLQENESGVDNREKFRIRSYDCASDSMHLELKSKCRGYTKKKAESIDLEECLAYIQNKAYHPKQGYLKKKLYAKYMSHRMQPVCIVEYERIALVEKIGNVRVTFDRNIGVSYHIERFYEDNIYAIPVLPKGWHVLEVKYDEFLPDYIKTILKECTLQKTSFSKYYYGRMALDECKSIMI